jgi:hypothetical protein
MPDLPEMAAPAKHFCHSRTELCPSKLAVHSGADRATRTSKFWYISDIPARQIERLPLSEPDLREWCFLDLMREKVRPIIFSLLLVIEH